MSCNTKTSLAAVIDAVNAQLNNNYVDRDDPRIDQGVFTEPTIRGGLMLDEAAKLDFCGYVTECGQREPFGKQWVDRPLYPYNTLVSYEDEGEIKSHWQDIDDVVAGTEIGESYTAYEETRNLGLQGYTIIDSFELGATLTQRNEALRHSADGKLYRWAGDLPKVVPASSTPTSSGGMGDNAWLDVSDVTLRQELANPDMGAAMVGFKQLGSDEVTTAADIFSETVSVTRFIPKSELAAIRAGTSTYDCAGAFEAAALTGAGEVFVPEGTYHITRGIYFKYTNLRGTGQDRVMIIADAPMEYMFRLQGRIRFEGIRLDGKLRADKCLFMTGVHGSVITDSRIEGGRFDGINYGADLGINNSSTIDRCLIRIHGSTYSQGTASGNVGDTSGSIITITGAGDLRTIVRRLVDRFKATDDTEVCPREIIEVTENTIKVYPPLGSAITNSAYSILQGSGVMIERYRDNNLIKISRSAIQACKVAGIYDLGLYGHSSLNNEFDSNGIGRIIGLRGKTEATFGSESIGDYFEQANRVSNLYAYALGNPVRIGGTGSYLEYVYSGSLSPRTLATKPESLLAAKGIEFPAAATDYANANTLDDYEEGTWTPIDATPAKLTFLNVSGRYTKIGRQVIASCRFTYPVTTHVNPVHLGGLPFPAFSGTYEGGVVTSSTASVPFLVGGYSPHGLAFRSPTGAAITLNQLSGVTINLTLIYTVA